MKHNKRQETLTQSIDRNSKNSYLLNVKQETANKWLSQRKMNSQKRNRLRKKILDNANMSNDENYSKGMMYFFKYDAKTKMTLPYYDEYPLILPFAFKNGLMYGLNVHYIPPKIRAVILDFLLDTRKNNISTSVSTIVQTLADNSFFKPAIHSYYKEHIVSNVEEIPASEWENIIFLPLAKFTSHTHTPHSLQNVYSDYNKRI